MTNILLFGAIVVIWGSTWIAITFQIGLVPVVVSVFYRFALSGLLMLIGLFMLGRLRFPVVWRFVFIQALCLFSFNFISFYLATELIPSGLVSVIFSLASIINAINARIFFRERISARSLLAGLIGLSGLSLLFGPDLIISANSDTLHGILWATLGTSLFSFGNMASRRNSAEGISPIIANAWGMGIGGVVLFTVVVLSGQPIIIPQGMMYWSALLYLSVVGSIVAFTAYLSLVQRIGAVKSGYATVFFPVVALLISTVFEGYQWHWNAIAGIGLTMLGNVVMFAPLSGRRLKV